MVTSHGMMMPIRINNDQFSLLACESWKREDLHNRERFNALIAEINDKLEIGGTKDELQNFLLEKIEGLNQIIQYKEQYVYTASTGRKPNLDVMIVINVINRLKAIHKSLEDGKTLEEAIQPYLLAEIVKADAIPAYRIFRYKDVEQYLMTEKAIGNKVITSQGSMTIDEYITKLFNDYKKAVDENRISEVIKMRDMGYKHPYNEDEVLSQIALRKKKLADIQDLEKTPEKHLLDEKLSALQPSTFSNRDVSKIIECLKLEISSTLNEFMVKIKKPNEFKIQCEQAIKDARNALKPYLKQPGVKALTTKTIGELLSTIKPLADLQIKVSTVEMKSRLGRVKKALESVPSRRLTF